MDHDDTHTQAPRTRSRRVPSDDRRGHAYERSHVCAVHGCGKAFTRLEHLRRHQLNHDPAKWTCTECPASFARKDLYTRHFKLSHDKSNGSAPSQSMSPSVPTLNSDLPVGDTPNFSEVALEVPVVASGHTNDLAFDAVIGHRVEESMLPADASHEPFSDEIDRWDLEVSHDQYSRFDETDIDWFWQNQSSVFDLVHGIAHSPKAMPHVPLIHTFPQERDHNGEHPPPRYLQEARTKAFIPHSGDVPAPNCGFPICNALGQDRRIELLMDLRDITDVDIRDPIFSLNSMKQGIHLWSREISTEYNFLHRELLLLGTPGEITDAVLKVVGEPPGAQLVWSAITFGWALMTSKDDREFRIASEIQRSLRASVLSHPKLTDCPPLWLVQTLFVVLLFVRYQGSSSEYGGASMFHGVLLEAVLRLDHGQPNGTIRSGNDHDSGALKWAEWIRGEAIRRLIVQTFILDVKNALLFGGEPTMTFKDMANLRIPTDLDAAWYAQTVEEWAAAMASRKNDEASRCFTALLKELWRPSRAPLPHDVFVSGSITVMYGILSVAREVTRREDSILTQRPDYTTSSLSATVEQALSQWEVLWRVASANDDLPWMIPTCNCLLQLARSTLYDISPVDLQVVAGKGIVEGKRKGPSDYSKALRRVRTWAREERGNRGVARAATVVRTRLCAEPVRKHCQHCLWCLYLATLTCWNFEYATRMPVRTRDLAQNGRVTSSEVAREQCHTYLNAATKVTDHKGHDATMSLPSTTGMLIVVTRHLESCFKMGMIQESIEVLQRLTGVRPGADQASRSNGT